MYTKKATENLYLWPFCHYKTEVYIVCRQSKSDRKGGEIKERFPDCFTPKVVADASKLRGATEGCAA